MLNNVDKRCSGAKISLTDRQFCIDATKAIAIVLMVFGHALQYGSGGYFLDNSLFFQDLIFKGIYSFHMPLFAVVSGYLFFKSVQKRTTINTIKSRVLGLLVPIFCWSIMYRCIVAVLSKQSIGLAWFVETGKYCLTNLWFLWAIFFCSCIVLLIRKVFRDHIAAYLMAFLLLQLVPNRYNLQYYAFLYPYFVGAYLFHKHDVYVVFKKPLVKCITACVCLAAWLGLLHFFREEHYIYKTGTCILQNNAMAQIAINAYRYAVGAAGSVLVISLVSMISTPSAWFQRCCRFIGSRTLGIYILSTYLNVVLIRLTVNMQLHYGWTIIETIVIMLIALGITYGLEKNKISRVILLGGR